MSKTTGFSLDTLYSKLHMCSTSVRNCIMTVVFNFTMIFIISVFMLEHFSQSGRYDSYSAFVNVIILFFSKLIIFITCSHKDSLNFLWNLPFSCIMLFSYSIKHLYRRNWIFTGKRLTYFFCWIRSQDLHKQ